MATAITSWVKTIGIPLVPNLAIKDRVIEVCRDFCKHTQLWDNQALTAIDIVSGTADYALTSSDGDIVSIDEVFVDSARIAPTVPEDEDLPSTWRDTTSSRAHKYLFNMADTITLIYTPSESLTGGLEVYVILMPLETATTVEDFLWRDYWKVIRDGVRWLLYDIPGTPWYSLKQAEYYKAQYMAKRDQAAGKRFTGRTNAEIICGGGFFA